MFRAIRPAALYRSAVLYKAASPIVARNAMALNFARTYASAGLARSDVEKRIALKANFNADLGLDSLDTVEVVMAIEEEFSIEIPDKDADEIKSAEQAVEYISKREDAH
ncbi:Acyl carrier protein, mitochondrial [Mortierella sp. GBA35]|nr:Acyl carrier protein, mitochondrial [Mortierella sp. GBA35]